MAYIFNGYGRKVESSKLKKPFSVKQKLSIVIPTYNEAENIERIIKSIIVQLKKTDFKKDYEFVIVDDDSKDDTPRIIDFLSKKYPVIAVHRIGLRGLFSAISDGIFVANGEYILTMDADFSHPPELIPEMLRQANKADIVYATRFSDGGGMVAPPIRKYGSRVLNMACRIIGNLSTTDFGGQFRLMKKEKYEKILFKYDSVFGEYGIELFYRAQKLRYKLKSVPFVYKFRKEGNSKMGSSLKIIKLALIYLGRTMRLRFEAILDG